jgi:hypothetical protein
MPKKAKANILCQQNQKREGCSFHLQTEYSAGCRKCTNWTCRTKSWLKFLQEEQVFQINKEAESVAGGSKQGMSRSFQSHLSREV